MKEAARLSLHLETPPGEYGPVEDIHLILDHLVTTYLKMKGSKQEKGKGLKVKESAD